MFLLFSAVEVQPDVACKLASEKVQQDIEGDVRLRFISSVWLKRKNEYLRSFLCFLSFFSSGSTLLFTSTWRTYRNGSTHSVSSQRDILNFLREGELPQRDRVRAVHREAQFYSIGPLLDSLEDIQPLTGEKVRQAFLDLLPYYRGNPNNLKIGLVFYVSISAMSLA